MRIELRNFMIHKEYILELEDGVYSLLGPNGSGKTSIVEGILYSLYGIGRVNQNALIRQGANFGYVKLTLPPFTIERGRKNGIGYLNISKDDVLISEGGVRAGQEIIASFWPYPLENFLIAITRNRFSFSTPTERKTILQNILGLEIYETIHKAAKKRIQAVREEINGIEHAIKNIPRENKEKYERILEMPLPEQPQIEEQAAIEQIEFNKRKARLDRYRAQLAEYDALPSEAKEEYESLLRIKYANEEYNANVKRNERIRAEIDQKETQLKKAQKNICPVCGKILADATEIVETLKKEIEHLRTQINPNPGLQKDYDPKRLAFLQSLLTINRDSLLSEINEIERLDRKIEKPEEVLLSWKNFYSHTASVKTQKEMAARRLREIEEQEKRIQELQNRKRELEQEESKLAELEQAVSKNGIQAWIIDYYIPEIMLTAQSYLDTLGFKYRIDIYTLDEGKETLEISVNTFYGKRDVESLSNGEKTRLDLALRAALAKTAKVPYFIIDEGLDTLDTEGQTSFVHFVEKISEDFQLILIMTHINRIAESFGKIIRLGE